ncbi:hypothetical protein RRG08_021138 [Elysia crispata]|uniref:Uncharacterized protein n=1 Tax=Elysia crispata TaxID=231223 RepID=A0AAE0Z625_9GAST|nr:hypothetical protein RRG08_021138 [Elysia crispata]
MELPGSSLTLTQKNMKIINEVLVSPQWVGRDQRPEKLYPTTQKEDYESVRTNALTLLAISRSVSVTHPLIQEYAKAEVVSACIPTGEGRGGHLISSACARLHSRLEETAHSYHKQTVALSTPRYSKVGARGGKISAVTVRSSRIGRRTEGENRISFALKTTGEDEPGRLYRLNLVVQRAQS